MRNLLITHSNGSCVIIFSHFCWKTIFVVPIWQSGSVSWRVHSTSVPLTAWAVLPPSSEQAGNKSNADAEETDEGEKEDRVVLFTQQADQKQLY